VFKVELFEVGSAVVILFRVACKFNDLDNVAKCVGGQRGAVYGTTCISPRICLKVDPGTPPTTSKVVYKFGQTIRGAISVTTSFEIDRAWHRLAAADLITPWSAVD